MNFTGPVHFDYPHARQNNFWDARDITYESGDVTEPVTLQEVKNYLRLEGVGIDNSGVIMQPPITLTLLAGAFTVQDNLLIGGVITTLSREGTVYSISNAVGNLIATFNSTTGVITFQIAGSLGGEMIVIAYGTLVENASDDAFQFDDALITDLIKTARESFEQYCGLSLVPKTIEAMITNECGGQEIGRGPVNSITSIEDEDGEAFETDEIEVTGVQWKRLRNPRQRNMKITYEAGYTTIPKPIKTDLLRLIAYLYENRGENAEGKFASSNNSFVSQLASKYSRNTGII